MTQTKTLPKEITSYDLLKTVAIILMIIDHVGYYFFPETEAWWRTFGRMCVPIWFFLIGYARSRDIGPKLWIGGGILVVANIISGMYILPLNILFTILLCRLLLDEVMRVAIRHVSTLGAVTFALIILTLPTAFLTEYGTQALMITMFGWMVRHQKETRSLQKDIIEIFLAVNIVVFVFLQSLFFGFNDQQTFVLGVGTVLAFGFVWLFKPKTYPKATQAIPGIFVSLIQFTGRRTLEIYVAHLLLFKAMGMVMDPERFGLFNWSFFVF
ncbi:MAG: TraX family protein [Pseudomonadota bacterium]